jgi:predicted GH43/DUF377 family glycosyl hydrolase
VSPAGAEASRPSPDGLATRLDVRLEPDPGRVIAALFMPGEDLLEDPSRSRAVIDRVLALSDGEVESALSDVVADFAGRHRHLDAIFGRHFDAVASRLPHDCWLSEQRRQLIGAYFTHEQSPEGACLTNPSMVPHPDQRGLEAGALRFVLSARAIGEGHASCLEFRAGVVTPDLSITLDPPGTQPTAGRRRPGRYDRAVFSAGLAEAGCDTEVSSLVLDQLGERFDRAALDESVATLDQHLLGRQSAREAVDRLAWLADNNYEVSFDADTALGERVLVPQGPAERKGIEDARFVRFVDDAGAGTYYATYTAYDGSRVAPHLLETHDFQTFRAQQLTGPAARNKGMALFPRRIGGRYACLSRWDRESNSVATSDDGLRWGEPVTVQVPHRPWDLVQLGNCGSPIETAEGWLVLTHGVGPMRTYAIGAALLDLDDPSRVVGILPEPLLSPAPSEREGYVPNVVYSCGGLRYADTLLLPYGFGDRAIGMAAVDLPRLLDRLVGAGAAGGGDGFSQT